MLGGCNVGPARHVLVCRQRRLMECAWDVLSDGGVEALLCEGATALLKTTGRRRRGAKAIRGDVKRDIDLEAAIVVS